MAEPVNLLRCETCDIELHGRDVYFDGNDSLCRTCNNPVGEGSRRRKRHSLPMKPVLPLPPDVKLEQKPSPAGGSVLHLVVPWKLQRPQDGLRLFGWIVVAAVVLGGIQGGLAKLPSFAIGAAVVAILWGVRQLNRTRITVSQESIRVSHGPIPWVSRKIDTARLEQLYVDRRPIAQKTFDYNVRALLEDGSDMV